MQDISAAERKAREELHSSYQEGLDALERMLREEMLIERGMRDTEAYEIKNLIGREASGHEDAADRHLRVEARIDALEQNLREDMARERVNREAADCAHEQRLRDATAHEQGNREADVHGLKESAAALQRAFDAHSGSVREFVATEKETRGAEHQNHVMLEACLCAVRRELGDKIAGEQANREADVEDLRASIDEATPARGAHHNADRRPRGHHGRGNRA